MKRTTKAFFAANTCYFIPTKEKWILAFLNSKLIEWFYSFISNKVRGGYLRAFSDYMKQVPIAQTSQAQQTAITKLVDYILFLKANTSENESRDQLMVNYFEQIIDALVYELYLPDEIHTAGKEFFAPLLAEGQPALAEIKGDKLTGLRQIFDRLFHKDHVIRQNIFFLDTIESIRIIEGKA